MKYTEWLNDWLSYYVKPVSKETTYNKYRQQVSQHIAPNLGYYEVNELTANLLQKFTVELSARGLAANTVYSVVSVLKNSLHRAVKLGIADRQFADGIARPKMREKQVDCFTKDEQRKIEQYIFGGGRVRLYGIILCMYTGLRIGELLALKWENVDLSKGLISVTSTCRDGWTDGKYVKIFDTPKTLSSQRVIPIPKQLFAVIGVLKTKSGSDYVIDGRSDYGAEVRTYQRSFEGLLKKLGIVHRGFHSLRHTFATRAIECGMDVKTLSEILGHKNAMVTLNRYAHSMMEYKTEMMNKVGTLLV